MLILGIESSCDETAAAVVCDGREIRSNVIASQHELHREYAGVVPEIASRAHVERMLPVVRRALADARISLDHVQAIAVGHRPGLIGSLLVGVSAAKALAWSLQLPLIGVDHLHAHLYAPLLHRPGEPARPIADTYPAIGLVVSGGHSLLAHLDDPLSIRQVGSTIDDAIGEAYDKVATLLGIEHPGGPRLDRLARDGDPSAYDFPISRLSPESLDFSFSGLKTAVLYAVRGQPERGDDGRPRFTRDHHDLAPAERANLAAAFQKAAVDAVILKLTRALDAIDSGGVRSILVGGGVSANSLLRERLIALGHERDIPVLLPPMPLCMDNAAMLAGLAHCRLRQGESDELTLQAAPSTSIQSA